MRMYLYYVVELLSTEECKMLSGPFSTYAAAHESHEYKINKHNVRVTVMNQVMEVKP